MNTQPNMDPVQAMLAQTSLQNTLFAANSRYFRTAVSTMKLGGQTVAYLRRRFLPQSASLQTLQLYTVAEGMRLDNVAAQFLGDPTLFWRICDANDAMRSEGLPEEIGTRLRITMPPGVTGTTL